jgi:hypothetical protein
VSKRVKSLFPPNLFLLLWLVLAFFCLSPQVAKSDELDLPPEIKENSPVLRRWLEEIPDVLEDIKTKPRFSTRLRLGYSQYPSNVNGWILGIEDLGINKSPLTFSADYQGTASGEYNGVGARLQYYILPLGSYLNFAPILGYRYFQRGDYHTNGVNLGVKLVFPLSAKGGADIFVSQNFVFSGNREQIGITTISLGYAFTSKLRISTDIEQQNSIAAKDTRWGIVLEILGN